MYLYDGNLVIRTITNEDLEALWEVAYNGDGEWMKYNGPYFNDPVYEKQEFIETIGPKRYVNQEHIKVITVDDLIVGTISYYFEDGELRKWLEYGIVLYSSQHWGQQIGKRASRLWINYLFNLFPDIQRVGFTTWSKNVRMMKLGDSLNMRLEGRIRKVRYYEGRYWDSIKYGILRDND